MRIEIRDEPFDPWAETAHYERESLRRIGAARRLRRLRRYHARLQ